MPSIVDGLFAGRAGIQSHGTGISVLADNISNANTTGFKQSRADFADLLAGNLSGGGSITTGSGSSVVSTTPILTQGTFEFTGRGLDTGIDGNGLFVVQDPATGQRFYTRAGNFKVDTEGNLLDQNGFRVLGFPASGAGGLQELNVNDTAQGQIRTTSATVGGNLDAAATNGTVPDATPTFQELSDNSNFSTFMKVFDSLGAQHNVSLYFVKTGANAWNAYSFVDGGEVAGGTAGVPVQLGNTATLNFNPDGSLDTVAPGASSPTITIAAPNWNNGSDPAGSISIDLSDFTQFAAGNAIDNISQDGTGSGSVVGFSIEPNGSLFAQLDNGQTSVIGTIALSTFANSEGLRRVGGSLFAETSASGEPVIGQPNTGTFGAIESGALELSNSDIASDFIKLISLQRGFQGSSRIITNINDLLNEIINLA